MSYGTAELPLITVIVPVHNGQEYLRDCIKCLENQSYPNIEIIIVNDGSTDQTEELCRQLRDNYGNITVLELEDKGVSAARNEGLRHADGAYITFVDADDRITHSALQILYQNMERTSSDISGCSFAQWSSDEEWLNIDRRASAYEPMRTDVVQSKDWHIFDREHYLSEAILQGNSRCWSKLYKKSVIGDIRFREDVTIGEDMLFLIDLLPHVNRVTECDFQGYGYYRNPTGAMNRAFRPAYMDQIKCWELAATQVAQMNLESTQQMQLRLKKLLVTGIMLTAGKLAMLSGKERRENAAYIRICHKKLLEALQGPDRNRMMQELSRGYRCKTLLFGYAPKLYLQLYHLKKG